jgi:predicted lipoprotein
MASFTLQAFKAGAAPRSFEFADEQTAYAETMRLQRSGSVDALRLVRTKDQKVLFDTTKGGKLARKKRSKLPLLALAAIVVGIAIAFAGAFLKGH